MAFIRSWVAELSSARKALIFSRLGSKLLSDAKFK